MTTSRLRSAPTIVLLLWGIAACGSSGGGAAGNGAGGAGTGGSGGSQAGGAAGDGGTGGTDQDAGGAAGSIGDASDDAQDAPDAPPPVVDPISGVVVSTIAGSDVPGTQDGTGASAHFSNPVNLVIGPSGDLIVADFDNGMLRRVTPSGHVTTLTNQTGFQRPFGLAFTPGSQLIVQTDRNEAGGSTIGTLWTVDTTTGAATVLKENLGRPRGIVAFDASSLFMSDVLAHWTRRFALANGAVTLLAGQSGTPGFADGTGVAARFNGPYGAALLPSGDVVMADMGNNAIRVVTAAGAVTTLAGNGAAGMVDGDLASARFSAPRDVAVDASGRVFVSDNGNHRIRLIDPAADTVRTVAGDGTSGFADGDGQSAQFFGQEGIDVTTDGKTLYVADGNGGDPYPYHRIRKVQLP